MQNLTDTTFHAERTKPGYFLVDFWAIWCPPCKAMNPVLDAVTKLYPQVTFAKVNATENQALSEEYKIDAIPAFLLFKDGELVHRWMGLTSVQGFCDLLDSKGVPK